MANPNLRTPPRTRHALGSWTARAALAAVALAALLVTLGQAAPLAEAQSAVRKPSVAVSAPGVLMIYTAKGGDSPGCTSDVEYRQGSSGTVRTVNVTLGNTKQKGDHYRFTTAELTAGAYYQFRVQHTAGTNVDACQPHNTWSDWTRDIQFKAPANLPNIGAVSVTARKATGHGDTTGAPLTNNQVQRGNWVALHFEPVNGGRFPHNIMLQACSRKNAQDIDWNDCSRDGNLFGYAKRFDIKRGAREHWYWFEVRSTEWGNNNTINLRFRSVSGNYKYFQWEAPIAKCWTRHGAYDPCKRLRLTAKNNVSDSEPDSTPPDQLEVEIGDVPQSEQQVTPSFVPDAVLVATVTAKADNHPSASAAERLRKIVKGMTGEAGGYTAAQCRETATHHRVLNAWQPWCDEIERRENFVPGQSSDPEISISAGSGVTEGGAATFTITANPVPAADLAVSVNVSQQGDYGVTVGAQSVIIPTTGTATLTVATADDSVDEADGSVTATLAAGTGYTLGTSSASVAIADNDDAPPSTFVPDAPLVATVTAKADNHASASAAERLRKIVKGMTGEAGGYTAAECRETATHYGVLNVWQPWCAEIERRENWGS